MNVIDDDYEFFNNEIIKCNNACKIKKDHIEYFEEDWKKKLGYKDLNVKLKKQNTKDICNAINEILKKYIKYKREFEYPKYSENDKILFDQFVRFFEIDEMSWLYRCVPAIQRGTPPILLAYDTKLMYNVKLRYLQFVAVLRKW